MASDETQRDVQSVPSQTTSPGLTAATRPERERRGLRTFSSLQNNRDFRYLFTGNLCGNGAHWLQLVTIGWLALGVTGSPFHSIMAVAVRALPILLIGPWGGVLVDRWDRRTLAIVSQTVLAFWALIFAVLVSRGQVDTVWHVYGYSVATGIAFTVIQPARQALIANTVRRSDIANALALSAMSTTSMRLLGAGTAGVLLGFLDFQWNFFVECGLYVGMGLLMIPMRTPYQEVSTARGRSPLSNLREGLGYVLGNRIMFRLMLLNFTRAGVFGPLLLLLPAYASGALDAGPGTGTAMIVVMGIGGTTASLLISTWGFFTRKGLVCLITLLSGSGVVFTLGLSSWVWLSLPVMVVMGLSQTHFIVSNQTVIQTLVPDTLRGRVSSVWHYEQGLIPLFAGVIGLVANVIGIGWAMVWFGGFALALGLFFLLTYDDIRQLD